MLRLIIKDNLSHHHTMFAEHFRQLAGVNTCDAGNVFTFQPVTETFHCVPVAVFIRIVAYDNRFRMDFPALHESSEPVRSDCKRGNSVVTYQRIGKSHQLSGIRRVGKALGISGHGSIENYFARHRLFVAKRLAGEPAPVVKD